MVYSEVGAQRGSWKRPLLGFFETCGGCKAFVMACNWPFCGPCIFARISARVAWPKTTFSAFGDTPFLQWFRISLLLVCVFSVVYVLGTQMALFNILSDIGVPFYRIR